jgi:hypothetical protein
MSRIVIEYNPPLSIDTQKLIRKEITPSMISNDETSCQYEISMVADLLLTQEEMANQKDLHMINDLIIGGVSYIEF